MAQLAAWIPLVYLDKLFALPSQFIFQHVREHIPAIVSYGFAKAELAIFFLLCHRFDANVLNANGIIAVCKVARLKVRLKTESWQFFTKRKNASYCVRYGKERRLQQNEPSARSGPPDAVVRSDNRSCT